MSQALNDIEKVIGVGECFELHVTGYSMLPLLGAGDDHIIVRRIDAEENIVGRIAMFRNSTGGIIVHRVLCVHNDIVVLRGDGNLVQTEQCLRSEIIGVVDKVRRSDDKPCRENSSRVLSPALASVNSTRSKGVCVGSMK